MIPTSSSSTLCLSPALVSMNLALYEQARFFPSEQKKIFIFVLKVFTS